MGNEQGKQTTPTTAGIQSMDESLQKKFSKGIQYNMKIVLRGDRNTGKSCLFRRMEGRSFSESYIPTNEIQVTSILWSYKVTNDTVKVEVWDVVDKGKVQRKESKSMLKLFNQPSEKQEMSDVPLDADFLDVYKGAHGVVFMFDITKQWTWKYVERELPNVPLHIPVMVLGSFSDMGEHRVVSREECCSHIEHLERPEGAAPVRYAEASMKDGFGLMHLHKFLSIPFLQLQQETLLHQLKVNREQVLAASEELDGAVHTEDQNYDLHLAKIQKLSDERKRKAREEQAAEVAGDESPMSPLRRSNSNPSPHSPRSPRTPRSTAESPQIRRASESSPQVERSGSFTSKIASFFSRRKEESKKEQPSPTVPKRSRQPASSSNVDDFVPEGEVDSKFFGGEDGEEEEEEDSEEEESEEDIKNPRVAMDEDLSSQEEGSVPPTSVAVATPPPSRPQQPEVKPKGPPVKLKSAKDIVLTESEEEDLDSPGTKPAQPKATPKSKTDSDAFSTSTPKTAATKKTSKGLLLEFNLPSPTQAKPKSSSTSLPADSPGSKPRERKSLPADSPSEPRERKRKKSKKSRHKAKEEEGGSGPPAPPPASEDPFGLTSSLDAWLSAGTDESSKLGTVLQPSQVGSIDKGAEVGVAEEEEGSHRHHHKKHKHRRREEGSTHKKHKHRSSHSHKEQPPGNYDVL